MKHRLASSLSLLLLYLLILPACQPKKQNTDNNGNRENHERFPLSDWVIEDESDSASFTFLHDTLEIVSPKGLTMWYNRELSGNYKISYSISLLHGRTRKRPTRRHELFLGCIRSFASRFAFLPVGRTGTVYSKIITL